MKANSKPKNKKAPNVQSNINKKKNKFKTKNNALSKPAQNKSVNSKPVDITPKVKSNKPFDVPAIEIEIERLKNSEDSENRKVRKKIRRLEFLKKKHLQYQNTENSLKLTKPDMSDDEDSEEDAIVSMDESDAPSDKVEASESESDKSDDSKDNVKKETLKGIKRFVVFVGNLAKSVKEDDLRTHFQKVGSIKSIRIPEAKESRKSGFGFIELKDRQSFEKTLSMHHTMLNNKRINVLFTNPDGSNLDRKEIKKKNAKFDAMRKAGLLEGSVAEHKKRSFRRKKKREAEAKAAASVKA